MNKAAYLDKYRLLGNSGLRVSPLALGGMTFGDEWGWGASPDVAKRIFEAYVNKGGNFIDTANNYTNGTSEHLIGQFANGKRHRLVIATKYTLPLSSDDPNSGGNHRKSMLRSVEESLRRLKSDYIDLLYLHAWDSTTPADEILRAMDDLISVGKVLYLGVSNTPAWHIARMQILAELKGWTRFVALQAEYNLIERSAERDLVPMAREMGIGVISWSPLASGVLTGKYSSADLCRRNGNSEKAPDRKKFVISNGLLSMRGLEISQAVGEVASELCKSSAQIALSWLLSNPDVTSLIVGARTLEQLQENLGAAEVELTDVHITRLNRLSEFELGYPYDYLRALMMSSEMGNAMRLDSRKT